MPKDQRVCRPSNRCCESVVRIPMGFCHVEVGCIRRMGWKLGGFMAFLGKQCGLRNLFGRYTVSVFFSAENGRGVS